jgi:CRISPR-associated protein Cmr4
MIKNARLFFLIAETPLHPGSGGGVLGIVDLPVQRERYTDFPKIEASSLKGCIKEAFRIVNPEVEINGKKFKVKDELNYRNSEGKEVKTNYLSLIFGPENEGESHASAISFTDARILLFPVKSLKGIFTWITCPMILERLKKDLKLVKCNDGLPELSIDVKDGICLVSEKNQLNIANNKIVLEEYAFECKVDNKVGEFFNKLADKIFPSDEEDIYKFWREKLKNDVVVLSDNDFRQFVKGSTEIITRTKISDITGTVEPGALWTEEYLPQDTIFYSIAMATELRVDSVEIKKMFGDTPDKEAEMILRFFENGVPELIQLGGNQTIGKGIVSIKILK